MKYIIISLLAINTAFQQTLLKGRILNKHSKAIPNVLVYNTKKNFTYTNENGEFSIYLKNGKITVSSLAYYSQVRKILAHEKNITIFLEDKIENTEEVIVYGKKDPLSDKKWLNTTDDLIQSTTGIHAISRANFSSEFSIRGLNPNETAIVIDGMKMFSACVDHMDPINNYIELENLEKIEINKGSNNLQHAQHIGASVNLVTKKATFNQSLYIEAQSAYESVSNLHRNRFIISLSDSNWAFRGTFSNKNSNDYFAGNNTRIKQSGFNKINYMLDTKYRLNKRNNLSLSYIGDIAKDIGYPKLLMDATKTKSHILRVSHSFKSINESFESSIYYTEVDHWMDDYSRDVTKRRVMPNMYMPMFGLSITRGAISTYKHSSDSYDYAVTADYYHLSAFADMYMESILPNSVNSYLLNLADVRNHNFSINFHGTNYLSNILTLKAAFRGDYSKKDVINEFGRNLLTTNWKKHDLETNYLTYSVNFGIKYSVSTHDSYFLSISKNQRMPTHYENYGYFLYNPVDDFFYYGNPKLSPESAYQININYEYFNPNLSAKVASYLNHIENYIYGVKFDRESKLYKNLSSVDIFGFEFEMLYRVSNHLSLNFNSEYTFGKNNEFNEALLMISPFSSFFKINYKNSDIFLSLEINFNAKQNRIADKSTDEDKTESFTIASIRSQYNVTTEFLIKYGIENIFDRYYHPHLSVNNLPAKGRSFYFALTYNYH